jgi:hypothetical protein
MTGKIGRGVLKRVKSNLENVDAKLTGVILNKVKSDAGPEYYQYHSYYYYGSEPQVKKGKKVKKVKKIKPSTKKSDKSNSKRKIAGTVALIIFVSIALLGFFWQDLGFNYPDWLGSDKKFFL